MTSQTRIPTSTRVGTGVGPTLEDSGDPGVGLQWLWCLSGGPPFHGWGTPEGSDGRDGDRETGGSVSRRHGVGAVLIHRRRNISRGEGLSCISNIPVK